MHQEQEAVETAVVDLVVNAHPLKLAGTAQAGYVGKPSQEGKDTSAYRVLVSLQAGVCMVDIEIESIRKNFSYNPETGGVLRIAGASKFIGKAAIQTTKSDKSLSVKLNKKLYRAHRVAWVLYYGVWPANDIDHINGDASDNRVSNLRDVTKSVNQQNKRKPRADNKTGFLGVKKASNSSGFIAQITLSGKAKYLGTFKTPEDANAAYLDAKRFLHPGCTI